MEQQLSQNPTEIELLQHYISRRMENGGADASVDEALLDDFREYKRQFEDLKAKLKEAEEQSARGESKPLDLDALLERVGKRLDGMGIPK